MRWILPCLVSFFALCAVPAHAVDAPENLTVLTDSELIVPLTEIARIYASEQHVSVTVVVTDGHDVAQEIGQGLDANMIVTANQPLLDTLNARGLIDVFGKRIVARNAETGYQAVLVASEALEASRAFQDYLQSEPARHVFTIHRLTAAQSPR